MFFVFSGKTPDIFLNGNYSVEKIMLRKAGCNMIKKKISVVVPVYNVECYLENCINSLFSQTMEEIEIIFVDDKSTDHSSDILDYYAVRDVRIRVIHHEQNLGTCYARKHGVLESEGNYILFVDADDYLEIDTCEVLLREMEREQVDILHFGSYLHPEPYMEQARIERSRKNLIPYCGRLSGENVLEGCFLQNKYRFTIWNKLYRADICRRAFENIENGYFIKGEDVYSYYVLAHYARSYKGIPDKKYHYRLGVGITGHKKTDLKGLDCYSQNIVSINALDRFLKKHDLHKKYPRLMEKLRFDELSDVITKYYIYLSEEDKIKGIDVLQKYWQYDELLTWNEICSYPVIKIEG